MRLVPVAGGGHEVQTPRIDVDHPSTPLYGLERTIPSPGGRAHWVRPGDTLQSIAAKVYGSPGAWRRLYAANRAVIGPDSRDLFPGQVLSVPY